MLTILEEGFNRCLGLMPDYSCTNNFWDITNKRSLSIEDAVYEGYFNTIEEAEEFLDLLNDFDNE